ncbi:hypothetical protein F0562_015623 [Nyssa sinensis]|uniref:Uncharacterized protein n=1 Tax=Nyssa sinensis TaxID=561372 RepID=A0A5J4ZJC5_9ASTE|nr:hypothetical protein F0562_015623 [Nyssa sinensis]
MGEELLSGNEGLEEEEMLEGDMVRVLSEGVTEVGEGRGEGIVSELRDGLDEDNLGFNVGEGIIESHKELHHPVTLLVLKRRFHSTTSARWDELKVEKLIK